MLRSIRTKTALIAVAVACCTSAISFVAALVYYERRIDGLPAEIRDQVDRQVLRNTPDDFDGIAELVVATVASAAAGGALGILLTRRHARTVATVSSAARRLRAGRLDARAVTSAHRWRDEADQLVDDFNHMAEQLDALEHERVTTSAMTAHELRTPVSVLRARLQAHLDGVIDPTRSEIQLLHDQTLLLERLIDDLRTISLSNARRLTLHRRPTDLVALANDTVASLQLLDQRPILVDAPDRLAADIDPERVRQVLSNLVLNAQRHTHPEATITVRIAGDADRVWIVVEDRSANGAVPAARSRGTGLGLEVVTAIAEAHAGEFTTADSLGGRTCTVVMPARRTTA